MSKHVTFGGVGQHEIYLHTTGRGQKNRRDRRKCEHYHATSKYCSKIRSSCVGPVLCKKYSETKVTQKGIDQKQKKWRPSVGAVVYNQNGKEGKIVTISGDVCTIQFSTGKKISVKYPEAFERGFFTVKAE